tara:strand:+ start:1398 stop:1571 length:174 start_codon:yes stop_codon:yes gene_type:complete
MIETKKDIEDIKEIVREVIKEELSIYILDDSNTFEEHGVYKKIQLRLNNKTIAEDRD